MLIESAHKILIESRRVNRLAGQLARYMPPSATVLDVGCGDGAIAKQLMLVRPDISLRGLDVLSRAEAAIEVELFDGEHIPFEAQSVDVVAFVDVLHHIDDPDVMLAEATRVARISVVIKDHFCDGVFARRMLRFMDRVGNERHGVRLPYNYWSRRQWHEAFHRHHLIVDRMSESLDLYPFPFSMVFERGLHFVACLSSLPGSVTSAGNY